MTGEPWVKEFPAEVMVCDSDGIVLAMNNHAEALFADDGGSDLLGRNVLDCHPDQAFTKLEGVGKPVHQLLLQHRAWRETLLLPEALVHGWSVFGVR